jgi:predicted unusual protein kinase regulating ubiquinone biosynthesis (AarF/ABC1/UbiB family)
VYRYGLFNADPHPGNLLFQDDGHLAVLDHGCVREFDAGMRRGIARLSRAVRADDADRIRGALVGLGGVYPDDKVFPTTRSLLRGFFGPVLTPGPHRVEAGFTDDLRVILADKRGVIRMRLPGRLLFLFRIRFGLHSELAKLRSVADWQAIEEQACAAVD